MKVYTHLKNINIGIFSILNYYFPNKLSQIKKLGPMDKYQ